MGLSDETGIVVALTWLLSRHGRYGRAVVLHDHLRQRRADRPCRGVPDGARPALGFAVRALRRFDGARLRTWVVRVAMRWAAVTDRLGRGRGRVEAIVGLLAAPLAVPAATLVAVLAAVAIAVVVVVDAAVWALVAAGRSVRSIVHRPAREPAATSFDWTPS